MKFLALAVLCVAVATSNAGIIPGAIIDHGDSAVIQGPSSRSAVHGPDGSVIAADAPGGTVVAAKSSGLVAHTGFVAAAPVVAHAAPFISAPVVRHSVVAHHAPLIGHAPVLRGSIGYPYFAPGSGIEGQYLHDFTETLYDDGQYHGEIYH
ncbi:hypothetical protein RN001_002909 [Aquatica leii]|uniref:Uncharacterized protein n=1 Tax=Aquatica leii TaxID=1421715 RepID=A0AAN7QNS7_9COLE|nr:hypothetical protein RN001_002909 [Aquatica leii]